MSLKTFVHFPFVKYAAIHSKPMSFVKISALFLLRNFIVKKSVNFICSFTSNVANHYKVFYNETKLHKIVSLINMQLQKRIFNMNEQQF